MLLRREFKEGVFLWGMSKELQTSAAKISVVQCPQLLEANDLITDIMLRSGIALMKTAIK